jgi:hypothetical protein
MNKLPKGRPQRAGPSDQTWAWITDTAATEYLSNPVNLECLWPFLGRQQSLSQAAADLGTSLNRMQYQISRLLELGLLRVTRTEPRAGRAIKHYTAIGEHLFLPFDTTSFATLEEALERAFAMLSRGLSHRIAQQAFALGLPTGLRVSRGQDGGLLIEPSIAPGEEFDPQSGQTPALIPGVWTSDLHLDFAQAKALQRELEDLRKRYSGQTGGQCYQMQMVLVPVGERG